MSENIKDGVFDENNCIVKHYSYDDIRVGQAESFVVTVTEEMLQSFCQMSGDVNPLHRDASYARSKGCQDKVVYGMLTASFLSTLAGVWLPGEKSLIHQVEVEFPTPVYVGDVLTVEGTVKEKNDTFHFLILKVIIKNQDQKKVLRGKMRIQVME